MAFRRAQSGDTKDVTVDREHSEQDSELDLKISRLQELKEKEKVFKESYSFMEEMFLCLRCLVD